MSKPATVAAERVARMWSAATGSNPSTDAVVGDPAMIAVCVPSLVSAKVAPIATLAPTVAASKSSESLRTGPRSGVWSVV